MTQPNFISRIRNAQWPVQANNDGKDYFIFQSLDDQGGAADVLYHDMALHGAPDLIEKVAKAWIEKRKLKIWLSDTLNKKVGKVELA